MFNQNNAMKDWNYYKKNIIQYYNETTPTYSLWCNKNSLAMHFGLWDSSTKNLQEALLNENKILAEISNLRKSDSVLDAGCGLGGSGIWLAKNYGLKVVGISFNSLHVEESARNAKLHGVDSLTQFLTMDFHKTDFKSCTFDVIWAVESSIQSTDKPKFLKEMYRILKPGGRLIVADSFAKKQPDNSIENKGFEACLHKCAIYNLCTWEGFRNDLIKQGFVSIKGWDKTKEIIPSMRHWYLISIFTWPYWKLAWLLGFISKVTNDHASSGLCVNKYLKKGLWMYAIFYAVKPLTK